MLNRWRASPMASARRRRSPPLSSSLRYASPSSRSSAASPRESPLPPASIHHYPDAEVSGGILAELWLERRPAVRSFEGASRSEGVPHREGSPNQINGIALNWRSSSPGSDCLPSHAKGAVRRLDLHLALVLRAGHEPKCAFRGLDSNAAGALVWVVDELVEANAGGRSDTQIATVIKTQICLAGTSGLNRFAGMHAATRRQACPRRCRPPGALRSSPFRLRPGRENPLGAKQTPPRASAARSKCGFTSSALLRACSKGLIRTIAHSSVVIYALIPPLSSTQLMDQYQGSQP